MRNLVTLGERALRVDLDHVLLSGSVKTSVFFREGRKQVLMQCYLNFRVIIKIHAEPEYFSPSARVPPGGRKPPHSHLDDFSGFPPSQLCLDPLPVILHTAAGVIPLRHKSGRVTPLGRPRCGSHLSQSKGHSPYTTCKTQVSPTALTLPPTLTLTSLPCWNMSGLLPPQGCSSAWNVLPLDTYMAGH